MKLAVTGGTGFIGSRLLAAASAAGHDVRALTRRADPPGDSICWVPGSLEDRASLDRLCAGSDCLIHVAGIINASSPDGFEQGNVTGTATALDAATAAGVRRFVHVSSLAAREPDLSLYGASKARSEQVVRSSALDWAIVRPPAVFGPGDRETFELFRMAHSGIVFLPPRGRLSLLHVDDLVALLLALAQPGAPAKILYEPDDGRPGGWDHRQFGKALGQAVGRDPWCVSTPAALIRGAARIDRLLRGAKAKLTVDRAAYFCHPDWVADPALAPPEEFWVPRIDSARGLAETAQWYRRNGWF